MKELKSHWKMLIRHSRFDGNVEALSVAIGRSPSYLRNLLVNNSAPGADVILGLSEQLGITPNELLDCRYKPPSQANLDMANRITSEVLEVVQRNLMTGKARPSGRDIMVWWQSNGGRLEGCDGFADNFDLYMPPVGEDRKIRPYKLGHSSLASKSLGICSAEMLEKAIAPLGEEFRTAILVAHQSSIDKGPVTTIETLDVEHPGGSERIKIEYLRTLAPVTLPDQSVCVLNYSELIR